MLPFIFSVLSSILAKGTVPCAALMCPLAFTSLHVPFLYVTTLLSTLLTVSEVLVIHAPYHSQYKVQTKCPDLQGVTS